MGDFGSKEEVAGTGTGEFSNVSSLSEALAIALRRRAGSPGADEAIAWLEANKDDVEKALSMFSLSGDFKSGEIPASCYNDLYKWTMVPVMRAVERSNGDDVRCTFSVNIRDTEYRQALYESATGKAPSALFDDLKARLAGLQKRPFDRSVYERVAQDYKVPGWGPETLEAICGPSGSPRMLVQEFHVDSACSAPREPSAPGNVLVQVFVARDEKLKEDRVHIEASGPWHRVTWLETSMMQAVYEALFRDKNRRLYKKEDSEWYPDWLAESLCRCVRSVGVVNESGLRGGLMTGRRTGGLALMNLQALYAQQAMKDASGASLCLGTSSVLSRYSMLDAGVTAEKVPRVMGTHAHELQMVIGSIYADLDDQAGIPITQVLAHLLYFFCSFPQGDVKDAARKVLMPMLPDTLGTKAFMKAATMLKVPSGVHAGEPFLSVIGSSRQDSGGLDNFRQVMEDFGFKGALMASEVEVPQDLLSARDLGYKLFGAGGFMGDSEKAWDPKAKNLSMASKVCRVHLGGKLLERRPVKTGETGDEGKIKEGKLEADGTLSAPELAKMIERAQALASGDATLDAAATQKLIDDTVAKLLSV